jgi:hypothetical protein
VTYGRDSRTYHGAGASELCRETQKQWDNTELGGHREARRRIRLDADPDAVHKDLAALVLTVVELLRQLMERQALRRVEDGSLTDDQIENIGSTLMALDARMTELTEHFGLTAEDLNLDLGPLGPLLSRDLRNIYHRTYRAHEVDAASLASMIYANADLTGTCPRVSCGRISIARLR